MYLQDRHLYMLEYQVPTEDLKLSQVFHKLETLRKTGTIDDYSVTQTTLDQVRLFSILNAYKCCAFSLGSFPIAYYFRHWNFSTWKLKISPRLPFYSILSAQKAVVCAATQFAEENWEILFANGNVVSLYAKIILLFLSTGK